MIRVLLVVDHAILRQELAAFFEVKEDIKVFGQADDAMQALERIVEVKPDVVVIDLFLAGMDGLTAAKEILRRSLPLQIILLTNLEDEERYLQALQEREIVCLPKYNTADLLAAVRCGNEAPVCHARKS